MSNNFYDTIEGRHKLKFGKYNGKFMADIPLWYFKFMIKLWKETCDEEPMFDFIAIMEDLVTG